MQQQFFELLARQAGVVVETCPTGIGRRAGAQIVGRALADVDVETRHLEPIVAEYRLAKPAAHASMKGPSGALPAAFQFGLNASADRIVRAPSRWTSL